MNGLIGYGRMGSQLAQIIPMEYICGRNYDTSLQNWPKIDVLFDFSHVDRIEEIIDYISKNSCKCILGTSNYPQIAYQKLKILSESMPIIYDSNYSLGIQLIKRFIIENKIYLKEYDIEIIECHHKHKADIPSGTANSLKDVLGQSDIKIHSLRAGNISSNHEICLFGDCESLKMIHETSGLDSIMKGIQMAYDFIQTKEKGWYTMEDVLKEINFNETIQEK